MLYFCDKQNFDLIIEKFWRIVSEVLFLTSLLVKILPADKLLCFNFFTISLKREYLKLYNEVVPANSNVKRPIFLTSGCDLNSKKNQKNKKIGLYHLLSHLDIKTCQVLL